MIPAGLGRPAAAAAAESSASVYSLRGLGVLGRPVRRGEILCDLAGEQGEDGAVGVGVVRCSCLWGSIFLIMTHDGNVAG